MQISLVLLGASLTINLLLVYSVFMPKNQLCDCPTVAIRDCVCPSCPSVGNVGKDCSNERDAYLSILRDCLTGYAFQTTERSVPMTFARNSDWSKVPIVNFPKMVPSDRLIGMEYPLTGVAMTGSLRLNNVRDLLERVESTNVKGDFVECGVWRGGASIYAKGVLNMMKSNRHVWLVDSFQGLPKARNKKLDDDHWITMKYISVSQSDVTSNVRSFGVLDNRVHFCKGYFVDILPTCPPPSTIKIAVLRMDGDMYESTMDILFNLYDKVNVGGYVIVDDYGIAVCKKAIHDFLAKHNIENEVKIEKIQGDRTGVYWKKTREITLDMDFYNHGKIK